MSDTIKTTVYLDAADYNRLKNAARARGTTTAQLVREAVATYAAGAAVARPASIGAARSGRRDLSERAEELLTGMGAAAGTGTGRKK
ncbi:MAG TPA: ribbon-helix-helix protein, CopG family [Gemmatimonadaceae bacterium]|nr:ribbon-helix-helix protein, CopG family [Gemmatimonadaceae bacterium]